MLTSVLFILGVVLLSLANGANDNFKGMATLWGSGVLTFRQALVAANIATFFGGCCAVVLGAGLLKAFSGKGIVMADVLADPVFVTAFAMGAALTVIGATLFRYPISTTHSIIGALAGAAFALPSASPLYGVLAQKTLIPLLVSPFLAAGMTWGLWQLRAVVGPRLVGVGGAGGGNSVSVGPNKSSKTQDYLHIISGMTVCFARGVNDAPKIASIWLLGAATGVSQSMVFVSIAFLMVVGSVFFSLQIAKVLSKEITQMDGTQGFTGNFVTALLVLFASHVGVGVSTTHVSVGSLFGIGALSGTARWGKIRDIILAWILTLPIGFLSAASVVWLLLFLNA